MEIHCGAFPLKIALGIDLGTTKAALVILNEKKRVLASESMVHYVGILSDTEASEVKIYSEKDYDSAENKQNWISKKQNGKKVS